MLLVSFNLVLVYFKYEKTTSAVYDAENCVDTLLELLQVYREKPGDKVAEKSASIFTRTCCLLAVLLKTEHCASVSSDHCLPPRFLMSLTCIFSLVITQM